MDSSSLQKAMQSKLRNLNTNGKNAATKTTKRRNHTNRTLQNCNICLGKPWKTKDENRKKKNAEYKEKKDLLSLLKTSSITRMAMNRKNTQQSRKRDW